MKIIEHAKPYSWLQWPVNLEGSNDTSLHITAKFFGRARINTDALEGFVWEFMDRSRFWKDTVFESRNFQWKPETYWVPAAGIAPHHVLELVEYPMVMQIINEKFKIIEDDFSPWKPHITVGKEYWQMILKTGNTPMNECLEVGALEFWKGKP